MKRKHRKGLTKSKTPIAKVEVRREAAGRLYLEGLTQAEIAVRLGVTQQTISNDLSAMQETWQERALWHFDVRQRVELAKLENAEREAMEVWQAQKRRAAEGGLPESPALIAQVIRCIELKMKLFGMLQPDRHTHNTMLVNAPNWDTLLAQVKLDAEDPVAARLAEVESQPAKQIGPAPAESKNGKH